MTLYFAPLQGYTDDVFLSAHKAVYGGGYVCFTPFIRIEKGAARKQDIRRLAGCIGEGLDIVPQIIFKSVAEFAVLVGCLKDLGCMRIDLNLGCPYPMQTHKGRGAAMISDLFTMSEVSQMITADTDVSYSVKMRLGVDDKDGWKMLLPILNDTPLSYVAMHPRIAAQLYGGDLYEDKFAEFVESSVHPVVYNGNICSISDINSICGKFESLEGIMAGRGVLARPSLFTEWIEGNEWGHTERLLKLLDFHDLLLERYGERLCGQSQILQKIKPFWDYMEHEFDRKLLKSIHKAGSLDKYRTAVSALRDS